MANVAAVLPDPKGFESFGWVMIVIVAIMGAGSTILGLVWLIMQIVGRIRDSKTPQPFRVSKEPSSVREEDLEALRKEMVHRFAQVDKEIGEIKKGVEAQLAGMDKYQHEWRHELRNEIQGMQSNAEERTVKIHDRINEVLLAVGRIQGGMKLK